MDIEREETKAEKIQRIGNLLESETSKLTNSISNWQNYLETASKFYKYSFTDQLLISAQSPNATLCAEYKVWQNKFNRNVSRGKKGIPLLYEENGKKNLRYVFDISTTEEHNNSKQVNVWEFNITIKSPAS